MTASWMAVTRLRWSCMCFATSTTGLAGSAGLAVCSAGGCAEPHASARADTRIRNAHANERRCRNIRTSTLRGAAIVHPATSDVKSVYSSVVPSTVSLPVYTLNLHQGYRCRHSGVCCTSGWDIPIDDVRLTRVTTGLATGRVVLPAQAAGGPDVFVRGDSLPAGAAAIVGRTPSGGCVFFDRTAGRHCAIHRGLGHAALPGACRHFPRIILLDDRGAHVAFSHVCPTAAAQLFRDDIDGLAVVSDPSILSGPDDVEGFDARDTIPPFLRPRVVLDAESRLAWETFVLSACSRDGERPEQVLRRLALGADRFRAWTPSCGTLASFAGEVLAAVLDAPAADVGADPAGVVSLYAQVMRTVPDGMGRPAVPDGAHAGTLWREWPLAWRTVNRYLGARAFGAWSAYQGEGVRTQVAVLAAALAVLDLEVVRRLPPDVRNADPSVLLEAAGAADLLDGAPVGRWRGRGAARWRREPAVRGVHRQSWADRRMTPSRPRYSVLVNASARQSARRRWHAAVSELESRASVAVSIPPSPESMDMEVRNAIHAGVDAVIVVGGDGTVNRVVRTLAGTPVPLGVIPLGTGNDFARALQIPFEPVAAARHILDGRPMPLDVVEVNGHVFCTAGLLGVPSDAALTVRRWFSPGTRTRPLIHLLGGAAYTLAGARHLLAPGLVPRTYRLDLPGGPRSVRALGVFIANTSVVGGGLVLPAESNSADGTVEVVLIRETPRWRLLYAFVCFARGWRIPDGVLEIWPATALTIRCEGVQPFSADGDLMCEDDQFRITVRPGALRVIG